MSDALPYTDEEIAGLRWAPKSPYGVTDIERFLASLDAARKRVEEAERQWQQMVSAGVSAEARADKAEAERDEAVALLREAIPHVASTGVDDRNPEWETKEADDLLNRIDALLAKHEGESRG
ncbi:MAG: hypothetical protein GY944_04590 [bacterium]|nr:hypothetical protein [bacterium]